MLTERDLVRPTFLAAALLCFTIPSECPAHAGTRSFFTGAAGILPADPADRAQAYFSRPRVRLVLEQLEQRPLPATDVERTLNGSGVTIADLERVRIVRPTARGYVIGFNYFTLADMRKIHSAAEALVPLLVETYRAHGAEFDRIFRRYPVKSVSGRRLATMVLAGFALNWDGLQMTAQLGYRRPELVTGPGWKYSFFASEEDPSYSQHGYIWGSSTLFGPQDNFPTNPVDFAFSSFGDPYSDPRMNFPDLFSLPLGKMSPDVRAAVSEIGVVDETYFGHKLVGVLGPSRARSIGPMLFALRVRPLSDSELELLIEPRDRACAAAFIRLLVATDYVATRSDGRYELIAPVLDRSDGPMLASALALHRRILAGWLKRIYPRARAELSGITAVRQGVPFESVFTQIWHEFFGLATRQMIAADLIEDPYSKSRRHPGSAAVLWRRSIYQLDLG